MVNDMAQGRGQWRTVDLSGVKLDQGRFKFTRADIPAVSGIPFAIIRYTRPGEQVEEAYGLRLDLDKRVFLDHLADSSDEKSAIGAIPQILEALRQHLS